jgi:hypothetical protein
LPFDPRSAPDGAESRANSLRACCPPHSAQELARRHRGRGQSSPWRRAGGARVRPPELSVNVIVASLVLSCIPAVAFGLLPPLRRAPRDPHAALREAGSRVAGTRGSLRAALAVAQLSLAVVLLSASALVVKSFARVLRVEPGIHRDHLLTVSLVLPAGGYNGLKSTLFYGQVAARLEQIPGIRNVAATSLVPFGGSSTESVSHRSPANPIVSAQVELPATDTS